MRSVTEAALALARRLGNVVLGREKDPLETGIFHRTSLIAFFAWVGLGADGLSSSCYGPEAAYLALAGHPHLAIWMVFATAATVAIIAASYSQIIELFPAGGGGYVVATRLLSPTAGVISGCALIVDYVLTITVSVASCVDALLSFSSHADSPLKVPLGLLLIALLVLLNLRGLKESIGFLLPIFLLFVVTHTILIVGVLVGHAGEIGPMVGHSVEGTSRSIATLGLLPTLFLFLRAYSLGAGTYTGIEAVSNGMPALREPRVRTGKRTMVYMAISLAVTAGGILLGYRLFDLHEEPGRTLNATLLHRFAEGWSPGGIPAGDAFIALALLSEGALLFVAAQTGFVGGPRTLAFMAVDRWMPSRFANLSSRLVAGNGILLVGIAAAVALVYTRADVTHLVVMYSINVFVTFTLSLLGMVRHWWQVRRTVRRWWAHLTLAGTGMSISLVILLATVILKFLQGGWVTVAVTGSFILLAYLIRRHYRRFQFAATMLNLIVEERLPAGDPAKLKKSDGRTAGIFVARYDSLGINALAEARELMRDDLKKVIFLSVVQVDLDQFRDEERLQEIQEIRRHELEQFEKLARSWGLEASSRFVVGTDVVEAMEEVAMEVAANEPDILFVAGQVVFQRETVVMRLLHNEVAYALQRRLIFRGLKVLIVPIEVPEEIW